MVLVRMTVSRTRLLLIIIIVVVSCTKEKALTDARKSVLAGSWYAADSSALAKEIDGLVSSAKKTEIHNPLIMILPHAGYYYSGKVAAAGYGSVAGMEPDIIVILGTNHHVPVRGASILPVSGYETPLGTMTLHTEVAAELLKSPFFSTVPAAHEKEHSVEIHLPFIQRVFKREIARGLRFVPILVGDVTNEEAGGTARVLERALSVFSRPLIVVSSDFTHYGRRFGYVPFVSSSPQVLSKKIRDLDYGAIDALVTGNAGVFANYVRQTGITVCGRNPIRVALSLEIRDFTALVLDYSTSGAVSGDYHNCVSYAAVALCGHLPGPDTSRASNRHTCGEDDKRFLLAGARGVLVHALERGGSEPHAQRGGSEPPKVPDYCTLKRGVFVTLKKSGRLRGCIGYPYPVTPLYRAVQENALNAAFRDPRFGPVKKDELKDISIEISVLTLPVAVESVDEILVGTHGLIIENSGRKGLLLPQVPVEYNWDRTTFLEQTCRKAGLPADAWQWKDTKIWRFEAVVFSEK